MTSRLAVRRATAVGTLAILMWATLALLTTAAGPIPPFQLVAMSFGVGGTAGAIWCLLSGRGLLRHLRQPASVWLLGVGGLFGFHLLYFVALRLAPPVAANLLNYLWPLLLVILSGLLPGERLRWYHGVGAAIGFAGAGLLVTTGGRLSIESGHALGYLAALASAFVWAGYSALSRRVRGTPTEAVAGFCLATSFLAGLCHFATETTAVLTGQQWLIVLAMGLGPIGGAFFVWDYGVKRGDIQALGAFGYATPLLSTMLLIVFGRAESSTSVWLACGLIVAGALLAGQDVFRRKPQPA